MHMRSHCRLLRSCRGGCVRKTASTVYWLHVLLICKKTPKNSQYLFGVLDAQCEAERRQRLAASLKPNPP